MKKKISTRKQGAYYLRRTKFFYEALGYQTEKLEVAIPFFIGGRAIFSRKDLLGADLAIWKKGELGSFTLVQVKSTDNPKYVCKHQSEARIEFDTKNVPLPKIIVVWVKGEKPIFQDYF